MLSRRDFGRFTLALGTAMGTTALGAGSLIALAPPARANTAPSHGLSSFGDLKYAADFAHFDYADPDAPKGGEYSTAVPGGTFDSLNPFILRGTPTGLVTLTADTLMTSASDEPDAMYGLLAESASVAEDRSSVTFTLRAEARFADGSPVTAEDVVWTFETLTTDGHPRYRLFYEAVAGAEVVGERAVRFSFKQGYPLRDMPMAVAGMPVLARAWWEGRDFTTGTLEPFLASGPYEVDRETLDAGRRIVLKRRPDYWGRDLPVNRGHWNFDRLRFDYYRDRTAAFEGFKAGEFTFYEEFWSRLWATSYDFDAIERGDVIKESIPDDTPSGTQGFWFNLRREKFQDPRVRQAIAEMFDFEWSNKTLFYDLYQRTDSFFEGGGELEATGAPSPGELRLLEPFAADLPEGALEAAAYVPPTTDASGRARRAQRSAQRLLREAGYTVVDGKQVGPDGTPLEIEFLLVSEGFQRIVQPYAQNLERVGITTSIRTVDPAQYKKRTDDYDFDITVDRKVMQLTPGSELRTYFSSKSAEVPGSQNLAGVASAAVDALIEEIERAESREDLVTAVNALDRVLRAMQIWIPNWSKASHHIAYWNIYGRPATKPPYSRGVIDLWWLDEAKHAALAPQIGG
ncbi:MAG: extracellular solute-binding protein [Pseudomonadota bacterium]